ncbi:MAG: ATP-binding protein, partial [Actinomycetes bacterium]
FFLEPLRDALHGAGLEISYAVLRAPLEVCIERATARDGQPLGHLEVIDALWREFTDLGALEPHAVDVDAKPAGEIADLLAARVRDGSLQA